MKKWNQTALLLVLFALATGLIVSKRLDGEVGEVQYAIVYPEVDDDGETLRMALEQGAELMAGMGVLSLQLSPLGPEIPDTPPVFVSARLLLEDSNQRGAFFGRFPNGKAEGVEKKLRKNLSKLSDAEMRMATVWYGELAGKKWAAQAVLAGHSSPVGEVIVTPESGDVVGVPVPAFRQVSIVVSGVPETVENFGMVCLQDVDGSYGPIWEPAGGHGPNKTRIAAGAWVLVNVSYRGLFFPGSQGSQPDHKVKGLAFDNLLLEEGKEPFLQSRVVD